jgi:acyl carrier protein
MIISSRTPEGQPADCPVCRKPLVIEPSLFFGDATCPHCGSLLWMLRLPGERIVFEQHSSRTVRDRVLDVLAEQLGVDRDQLDHERTLVDAVTAGGDSLDMIELVMELEAEFDVG